MTAWQTALRRDTSLSENAVAYPALLQMQQEFSAAPRQPLQAGRLLRSLTEQALAAWKWLQEKGAQKFSSRRMRVAETVALGEKRFVTILQVDGTQLLIGSAGGQVSLLAVLDEDQSAWRAGLRQEQTA